MSILNIFPPKLTWFKFNDMVIKRKKKLTLKQNLHNGMANSFIIPIIASITLHLQ